MIEREKGGDLDPYAGIQFVVYDVADFPPRGSFFSQEKQIPPYFISKAPDAFPTLQSIIEQVDKLDPENNFKNIVISFASQTSEKDIDKFKERVAPEMHCRVLNLNFLRDVFSGKIKEKNGDVLSKGDKIAIILGGDYSNHLLVVNLSSGKYVPILEFDDIDLRNYTNEKIKDPPILLKRENKFDVCEESRPFEQTDQKEPELREAKDSGKRKTYPKETMKFFNRMRQADLNVENTLINNMELVVPVTKSIKRLAIRKGRPYVRKALAKLRNGVWDSSFDELEIDINNVARYKKPISEKEIKRGLNLLLKAERFYLEAILDFPWNKVGPEPFDTLIDVFWFRFSFKSLQYDWIRREIIRKSIISDAYRDAQVQRILDWVWTKTGYKCANLKELKEGGIKYDFKDVVRNSRPLFEYLDRGEINSLIIYNQKQSRPSGLTLLLWSTLKWASASEWKAGDIFMTSDFRYEDAQIWEEHFPDPIWQKLADYQGRLILPGETLPQSLSHLQKDGDQESQIRKELCFLAEQEGIDLADEDNMDLIEKAVNQVIKQSDHLIHHEQIAKDFQKAVEEPTLTVLMDKISKLPRPWQAIVLHRLGYESDIKLKCGNGRNAVIYTSYSIQLIINTFFDGKANRYYRLLKQITDAIRINS